MQGPMPPMMPQQNVQLQTQSIRPPAMGTQQASQKSQSQSIATYAYPGMISQADMMNHVQLESPVMDKQQSQEEMSQSQMEFITSSQIDAIRSNQFDGNGQGRRSSQFTQGGMTQQFQSLGLTQDMQIQNAVHAMNEEMDKTTK